MVKATPSNAGAAGLIPGQGAKIPYGLWLKKNKTKNRKNIITSSIKTLKIVHIKNRQKKAERKECFLSMGQRTPELSPDLGSLPELRAKEVEVVQGRMAKGRGPWARP